MGGRSRASGAMSLPFPTRDPDALLLGAALALLPFEPRVGALGLGPFKVTLLEAVALAVTAVLLWRAQARHVRPPAPVLGMGALFAVHVLSSALAPEPARSLKFALRLGLAAAFAAAVSSMPRPSVARALRGLLLGGAIVAALAVGEGAGWRGLDPLLAAFREQPFNVGGTRRASAGSEYPNLAGAVLMYALVTLGALVAWGRGRLRPGLAAAGLSAGLLFTYSRAALVGAGAGLFLVALLQRGRGPWVCLSVLAAGTLAFSAGEQAFALRLFTEDVGTWYGASYAPEAPRLRLRPGESTLAVVRVTNRGRLAWTRGQRFHLSYHLYLADRREIVDGPRTVLPHDVAPGETVALPARVDAPGRDGLYLLMWDMVQEQTAWFSGQGVSPASVTVSVGEGPDPGGEAAGPPTEPLVWRPGRRVLWPIALAMWRANPLLGIGSDGFRWAYGRWAGRATWDTRVFANNLYLETVADTGAAGLMALLGTLAVSARRAWRHRADADSVPLAALGLLAAVAVHGLADYVLAFTGHYLVVGLAAGLAGLPADTETAAAAAAA
jgi:O-antigen ligase